MAENLSDLYIEDGQLMRIFQERARQEEPDLCALDKNGNLVLFELYESALSEPEGIELRKEHYEDAFSRKNSDHGME